MTVSLPRAGMRPIAQVASGVRCFGTTSAAPWARTDASATLGVPTADWGAALGLGTSWAASVSAG